MFSVQNIHPGPARDLRCPPKKSESARASRPKCQRCSTQERMSCVAASAPLETSHATVFLLLQRFGCLNYVCLTRLSFPSCAQISRHTFLMLIFYDWITLGADKILLYNRNLYPRPGALPLGNQSLRSEGSRGRRPYNIHLAELIQWLHL